MKKYFYIIKAYLILSLIVMFIGINFIIVPFWLMFPIILLYDLPTSILDLDNGYTLCFYTVLCFCYYYLYYLLFNWLIKYYPKLFLPYSFIKVVEKNNYPYRRNRIK